MGLASSAGRVGADALKAVPGVGTLVSGAALIADLVPLVHDLFAKGEPDTAEMDKLAKARDGLAQQLVASQGMSMEDARDEVNQHLKPVIDEAARPKGGAGAGELLGDAAGLAVTGYMAHKAGALKGIGRMLGRGKAPTTAAVAPPIQRGPRLPSAEPAAEPEPMQLPPNLAAMMVESRSRELAPGINGMSLANGGMMPGGPGSLRRREG